MSQITQLIRALAQPLLLEPRTGRLLVDIFARKVFSGISFNGAELHAELGIASPGQRRKAEPDARVAVIPIYGLIAQHPQSLGASTDEIGFLFDAAMASRQVDAVVFDVDSPGGTVSGVPELAARLAAARGLKPMIAVANSLMASAAYWLASAADEVLITPSGEAGSIGVYTTHEDWSKALEQDGINVTAISAGRRKLEGAPWLPLSEEAAANLRERVDEVYEWFVKAVAANRGASQKAVCEGYGEGAVLGAEQAVKANLADRIGTLEDAIQRAAHKAGGKVAAAGARSAAWRTRELTLDSERSVA